MKLKIFTIWEIMENNNKVNTANHISKIVDIYKDISTILDEIEHLEKKEVLKIRIKIINGMICASDLLLDNISKHP